MSGKRGGWRTFTPQFEAYRSLRYHTASRAIAEYAELAGLAEPQPGVASI